jgi:hypothetical protein
MPAAVQEHRFAMFGRVVAILRGRFGVSAATTSSATTASAVGTTGTTGTVSAGGTAASSNPAPTGVASNAGTTNPIAPVDFSALAAPTQVLEETLARAEQHAHDQVTAKAETGDDTRDVAPARAELFIELRSVAGTARSLKGQVPGIGVLKAPEANLRATSLIIAAEAFAENAKIYQQPLIEHGQPANFVDQLTAAITTYKAAIAARGDSLATQRGATRGIAAEITLGMRTVTQLNANLQRALKNSPADLAAWNSARRITRTAATTTASAGSSTSTTTAIPTATGTPAEGAAAAGVTPAAPIVKPAVAASAAVPASATEPAKGT